MSFKYLSLLNPNEHTEDYHIRKPNDENFRFENGDKIYIFVGEKVFTFETNDIIIKYSLDLDFNDINFPYAYGEENIYFMLHQKFFPIEEYEISTEKDESQHLYKKDDELKGHNVTDEIESFVEYGNVYINFKIIHSKQYY